MWVSNQRLDLSAVVQVSAGTSVKLLERGEWFRQGGSSLQGKGMSSLACQDSLNREARDLHEEKGMRAKD